MDELEALEARLAATEIAVAPRLHHDARVLLEVLGLWVAFTLVGLWFLRPRKPPPARSVVARVLYATTTGTAKALAGAVADTLRTAAAAAARDVAVTVEISDAADYSAWERLEHEDLLVVVTSTWTGACAVRPDPTARGSTARNVLNSRGLDAKYPHPRHQKHVEKHFDGHLCL